jgi:uncharacterized membrane protein
MHSELIIVTVLFFFTGLLYIGLAIPLIKRKIPPNQMYGFRVKAAFASDAVWYDINEYSARLMRNAGIVILAAVPLLLLSGMNEKLFALFMVGIILIGTIVMVVLSIRRLNKLTQK